MISVEELLQRPYSRVLVPDESGIFAAHISEFPGCFAEGESPAEAYQNLESAAESWIEASLAQGTPIPEPNAWQAYSGTVSLRLPKTMHGRASECARSEGVSLNAFLVASIAQRVGAEDAFARVLAEIERRVNLLQRQTTRSV